MKLKLFIILTVSQLISFSSWSQCNFGGTMLPYNATPTIVGQTIELGGLVTPGDQLTIYANQGCTYTISTCGTSWNNRLTLFDQSQNYISENNDFCGSQAQLSFTASYTGPYIIQQNRSNCGTNNTTAQVFNVTLEGCNSTTGCTDTNATNFEPWATVNDPAACCYDHAYFLQLFDAGSNGWNGAVYTVSTSSGQVVYTGTLNSGAYQILELCLPDDCYELSVSNGTQPAQISWALTSSSGVLTSGGAGDTYEFTTGGGTCGCTDPGACNFDPDAGSDDGTCCYSTCVTITAGGGNDDSEISWEILDGTDLVAAGGSNISNPLNVCLTGCFTLNLYDSGNNGWEGATIIIEDHLGQILFVGSLSAYTNFTQFNFCSEVAQDFGCENVYPPGCPDIDAGEDVMVLCETPQVNLQAQVFETGETTDYAVSSIPYAPPIPFTDGVPVSIGVDDVWSYEVPLPFDFCFFGETYSRMLVGSNALISFDLSNAMGFCPWEFSATVPSTALPRNSIFGPYHDIDPSVCGTVSYSICGEAPCRFAVVNFDEVCHYQCTTIKSSCQIVIYETTNVIEVYIKNKPVCDTWNGGRAVVGIQDQSGTYGRVAPARQTGIWDANMEAWRFTPDGADNFEVTWFQDQNEVGSGIDLEVNATEEAVSYRAQAVYTNCNGEQVTVWDEVTVQCVLFFLPVEMLSFEAKVEGDKVRCLWVTATELNNDYFTVERSNDYVNWEIVGHVQGAGTSLVQQSYTLLDDNPLPGTSYYRIKQTDFDGESSYSWIRAVNFDKQYKAVIYPNPNSGLFSVDVNLEGKSLMIRDMRGREVPFEFFPPNSIRIRVPEGLYFLEVMNADGKVEFRERCVVD